MYKRGIVIYGVVSLTMENSHYAHINQIEIGYRYLKDHIEADTLGVSTEQSFNAKLFLFLFASEFMNSFGLKVKKWNASASATERVKLKQNSFDLTISPRLRNFKMNNLNESELIKKTAYYFIFQACTGS